MRLKNRRDVEQEIERLNREYKLRLSVRVVIDMIVIDDFSYGDINSSIFTGNIDSCCIFVEGFAKGIESIENMEQNKIEISKDGVYSLWE